MREYVTKDVGFWSGGDHLRRIRGDTNAPHPVAERVLDHLENGLILIPLLAYVVPFLLVYLGTPIFPYHKAPAWFTGIANAIFIGTPTMFIAWALYHLIPRLMGYRRVPKWELHAERRAQWLVTLDEKERARYLLEEDARDQAYRRGVATGYVAGRNSGRWGGI